VPLTESINYETPTVLNMRKDINIAFQISNNASSNTSYYMSVGSKCTEIKIVGAMSILSALLEAFKITFYFARTLRKKTQRTAPALKS